jgi:hypothetical protein
MPLVRSKRGAVQGLRGCESVGCAPASSIDVTPADRRRLGKTVADRNSPQKHVWRARIVLLTADRAGTAEIMREAGVSKTAV